MGITRPASPAAVTSKKPIPSIQPSATPRPSLIPENPLKSRPKPKVYNPGMCKSQFRDLRRPALPASMLMSDELHNWLLLMALKP